MPVAYSYKRFSTPSQAEGDSIRRQTAAAQRYIDDHPEYGLVLDTTLVLVDEGVSAFRGDNLKSGHLARFIRAVKDGVVAPGSWLLLESLDRFTRQSVNLAAAELLNLINRGIVVVTLHNGTIYREEDFEGIDGLVNLMGALIAMQGHHHEQVTKGKRVAAAWGAKYDRVNKGHILTRTVPFWLEVNADKTGFNVLADRVEVVREIFKRRAEGEGKSKIAADLTARGIPTPKSRGAIWNPSTIQKILDSDSVVGVLLNARGDRFDHYYPRVVDEATYQTVSALRAKPSTQGARAGSHPLTRLIKHDCGTTMRRINKGAKGGAVKLICPKCKNSLPFTKAMGLVQQALFMSQWVEAPSDEGVRAQELERELVGLDEEIRGAYEHWRKVKTLAARDLYERALTDHRRLVEELHALMARNTAVLLAMEDSALTRADKAGNLLAAVKTVVVNASLDTMCKTLTVKTISGKTIEVDDWLEIYAA